jgi:PIN domain nuclease of toxin-antitoxin system
MFGGQTSQELTSSLSEVLAKISHWLEKEKGWKEKEVLLSRKQLDSFTSADLVYLSGKMLREHSPQTMAQTFGQLSKPLPTLGVIDVNGNCVTQVGFYRKTESGFTLSDILQKPEEIGEEFFLSERLQNTLMRRSGTKQGKQQVIKLRLHEQ